MPLTVQPAVEFPFDTLCDLINRAFKGYVGGDFTFTPPVFAGFLAGGIHLNRSLVALQDGEPAAIAMLARRGWMVRVALMGVTGEFQNQGVGRWLLGQIAEQAKAAGDRAVVLEVIEQNPRAVHLYESCGYRSLRRLMGYEYQDSQPNTSQPTTHLQEVDIVLAARQMAAWEVADLPWQCSGLSLATVGAPAVAYQIDDCYVLCSNPQAEAVSIIGLAVPPEKQRQGIGTRLVGQLVATHPGKHWHVSPICPEEYGPIFLRNGFTPKSLNQFQMELRI